ncbi:MAG: Hsp33 family molecular chaperone HslO [Deltaproteobacteria bacterium]|nr:Hsp33 family molecular chaperone HslO [Deltaproteobacteria bacterium]MBW2360711.1 Hsp33 family molecular chaperone HslO [Deltaproteobacteria bacterium]
MERLRDALLRTFALDGCVSVRVLSAANLVREAAQRHGTSPTATVALGRALMGGLLLASEGQDGERVQLRVRGNGPLGTLLVTADSDGAVRGYAANPTTDVPLRGEHLGICDAIGFGELHVERNHASWKRPYAGIVPIVEGEIAQDLARYLLESEQKPSAVALGVYLGRDGKVEAAGGYLVQSLPGAADTVLADFEQRVVETLHPSELLRDGATVEEILARLLGDVRRETCQTIEPRFSCPCDSERVIRAALLLGREEIREIVATEETLEVRCEFCAELYRIPPDELGRRSPDA